jgi:hypothetical protein
MAYAIYYPGCSDPVPDHFCNECEPREHARVRSVAFVRKDFHFIDPSSPTEWQTGIDNKKIIVIPQTNGTFDGGSEVEGPGYGDQQSSLNGYNFQAVYNDPNYKFNADFYNSIKNSRNWKLAYRTETQTHLTENTVSIIPKNPVVEDLTGEVVWNVTVKWSDDDLPVPFETPTGIFECFDYTGAIV